MKLFTTIHSLLVAVWLLSACTTSQPIPYEGTSVEIWKCHDSNGEVELLAVVEKSAGKGYIELEGIRFVSESVEIKAGVRNWNSPDVMELFMSYGAGVYSGVLFSYETRKFGRFFVTCKLTDR